MIILGVDPGISGALAALSVDDMGGISLIDAIDAPTLKDGSNRQIDVVGVGKFLESVCPDVAYVENVNPMPSRDGGNRSMGATSAFRFGMACGALRAVLVSYSIPLVLVTPQSWKPAVGLPKRSDKEASRQMALKLVPDASKFLKFKNSHNVAEAMLLALYGVQKGGI